MAVRFWPRLCENAEKFGSRKNRPLKTTVTRFSRYRQWSLYPRKFMSFAFSHSLGRNKSFASLAQLYVGASTRPQRRPCSSRHRFVSMPSGRGQI